MATNNEPFFGGAGLGIRLLRELINRPEELPTNRSSLPQPEASDVKVPKAKPVKPVQQTQNFGQDLLNEMALPEEQPESPMTIPVDQISQTLAQAGYKDNPINIKKYLETNLESNSAINDLSGLQEQDDTEVLPPKSSFIKDVLKSVPAFQVLSNAVPALQVIIEGLERYEAAKVTFLEDFVKGQIPDETLSALLTGKVKTKFPDAKLRGSEQPEFGDIFRGLGLPEGAAATLGLTAEMISDIPVLGGAGTLFRQLAKQGGEKLTSLAAKEVFTEMKANRFLKEIGDALQGKGLFDSLDPAAKQTIRTSVGESQREVYDAGIISSLMNNSVVKEVQRKFGGLVKKEIPDTEALTKMHEALTSGLDSSAFHSLSKAQQTLVTQSRQVIDKLSEDVRQEILTLVQSNPEKWAKQSKTMSERLGAGKVLPPELLAETIAKNKGTYTRRYYEMYLRKNYKPSEEVFDRAVEGLVKDGFVDNVDEAKQALENFTSTKTINLKSKKADIEFKVNTNSFKQRAAIPSYLRDFMGEVKDPRFLTIQTVRDLAEARSNLRIFRKMDELGMFVDDATKTHNVQIKGGPLAFGMIDGKFTTQEVADVITHVTRSGETLDTFTMNMMKGLKTAKTIFNPKTHGHNFIGNVPFSILAGNSILNPQNAKYYKEMAEIWKTAQKVRKGELPSSHPLFKKFEELIENNIIGVELPSADKLTILEEMLDNPYTPKKFFDVPQGLKDITKFAADMYTFEDVFYKGAAYLKYTKGKGLKSADAVNEVYKWFPNYFEAAKISETARNTAAGLMLLNPFTTFRAEAHRIMLNGFRDSTRSRVLLGTMLGSRLAWNTAMLGMMGGSLSDIWAYYNSRPEAVSELLINPNDKEFDLNTRYLDPFNTRGLFAPLQFLAGQQGINPFDYLLDFTTMSPDFGYSNLIINAFEPTVTGKGRFGQELSPTERIMGLVKGLGPTSFTTDLPKILDPTEESKERFRRALRFVGIDVEKRNPNWINQQVAESMRDAVRTGRETDSIVNALNQMGFDGEKIKTNAIKKVRKEKKERISSGEISKRKDFILNALSEIGIGENNA